MKQAALIAIVLIVIVGSWWWYERQKMDAIDDLISPPSDQSEMSTETGAENTVSTTVTPAPVSTPTPDDQLASAATEIESGAFYFRPNIIKVKVGRPLVVKVDVKGGMHTFTIDELGVDVKTPGGQVTTVEFTPTKKGQFVFYCAIPGHRQSGQWGTLIVE